MGSAIDSRLSVEQRRMLSACRDPGKDVRRAVRLSIQYQLGAGIFCWLAISRDEPWWALAVLATFFLQLAARLVAMQRLAGVLPAILEQYELEILELRSKVEDGGGSHLDTDERDDPRGEGP